MTELTLEKRVENLEKAFLCYCDETEKKLEMLRENNNLLATEIEKLGGFQEDDAFEALDFSSIKELLEIKERLKNDDGVVKIEQKEMIYEEEVE